MKQVEVRLPVLTE